MALDADHYVDEDSIRDAVRRRSSFNLLHFETGLKIDVFVAADSEYEASVQARRLLQPVGDGPSARHLWIASAEDTILAKLAWYRRWRGVGATVVRRPGSDGVTRPRSRYRLPAPMGAGTWSRRFARTGAQGGPGVALAAALPSTHAGARAGRPARRRCGPALQATLALRRRLALVRPVPASLASSRFWEAVGRSGFRTARS